MLHQLSVASAWAFHLSKKLFRKCFLHSFRRCNNYIDPSPSSDELLMEWRLEKDIISVDRSPLQLQKKHVLTLCDGLLLVLDVVINSL